MTTISQKYIGGRFTSTPEDHFYADRVSFDVIKDDGEFTFFEFADGSKCKINADGEIFSANRTIPATINATGLAEIKQFLAANHKLGGDHFTASMVAAWATDAEFQLAQGNPATIEIRSFDSVSGAAVTYTISDAGIDSTEVEIDE